MSDASARHDDRWLFVSDIDDTLTGDDQALKRLGEILGRSRDRVFFAVNSSRPLASVQETLRDNFPSGLIPDATITAMGTEITVDGVLLQDWQNRFDGWPQSAIFDVLKSLGRQPHDPVYQTELKVSFRVPCGDAQANAKAALREAGLECLIIASGSDDFDILPPGAGKGEATLYLASYLGFPVDRIVAAGDSGNDLALLRAAPHRIAVGNARAELTDAFGSDQLFRAKKPHAAGVLEGLSHFDVLTGRDEIGT